MSFLSSREYCVRLIATVCAQAGCLASVVALESLRATHSGKDAACCSKVVDTKPPNKGQPPNSRQRVVYQLVR